jgi:hypothetical protein
MHHDTSRDAPPTYFIKPHAKYKHGGQPRPCFVGISWMHVRQGSMEVNQEKTSSGMSNNASEGVDGNVWKVYAVTKQHECTREELSQEEERGKYFIQLFVRVL